jgi:DNA polymerase IV
MALAAPRICCLDLDTFFVSVERLLDPSLEGKPVIVGGFDPERAKGSKRPLRGVVTAASYEVRVYGVRSGMSLAQAQELAPHAIYLPTRHDVYTPYAKQVRELAENYTPLTQVASIDEMFLDFSGCERLYHKPCDDNADATIERVVRQLTDEVQSRVGLPSSAGIATSRSVAKVACGLAKPRGVLLVPGGAEGELLAPLPVRKFPGIGPVAERKLNALGLMTLGEVANADATLLRKVFGSTTRAIQRGLRGMGHHELGRERPAFQEYDSFGLTLGSISHEHTFLDAADPARVEGLLCSLCERVCWRARGRGVKARTVTLKLRYTDFQTISRSRTIRPSASEFEVFPVLRQLLQRARTRPLPLRLLGVALSNLGHHDEQLELFDPLTPIHQAVDEVRDDHGFDALRVALSKAKSKRTKPRKR